MSKDDTAVKSLESSLRDPLSYDAIDQMMQTISKKSGISPKQLRDKFMKKHDKTPDDYAKSIEEDAPVNAVGGGNIAGIGVGPQGEPGVYNKKKKDLVLAPTLKRKSFKDFVKGAK
jgi:hypothetical protein